MKLITAIHDYVRPTLTFYDFNEQKKVAELRVSRKLFNIIWSSACPNLEFRNVPERLYCEGDSMLQYLVPWKMCKKLRELSPTTKVWAIIASKVKAVSTRASMYVDKDTGVVVEFR